ncbi:Trp biosynthesis-associated membrane protein [Clavibacter zhangzhiyongii]|uniref:Trp biosynthesis-associated membrane protein n=1 Tax=Clavibacter zhangzhiyongii TaxID=2768071 RepID=A0A7L7YZ60_9MICO|nr:Trp biosynthesis-associated membrane protein [Clavibacter zhangzhiyongii]QOD42751.1 Trp biosynthesis-associated membrane protein [Clavibacter zhangzhiyongii]
MRVTRRTKSLALLLVLATSAATFLGWSQDWSTLRIGGQAPALVPVAGSVAAPALSALALSSLALAGALAIAGRALRVVLGVLQVLIGATVALSALAAVAGPVQAGEAAVTTVTGVAGSAPVADLVVGWTITPWGPVTVVAGIASALTGVLVAITGPRWPTGRSRYDAPTDSPAPRIVPREDPVAAWDSLSGGADPTRRQEGDADDAPAATRTDGSDARPQTDGAPGDAR